MSNDRIIPAAEARSKDIEGYPYFAVELTPPVERILPDAPEDDSPVASGFTSPEEEAQRFASTEHRIQLRLQEAEREALEIQRRAYEEGFASGEAEGRSFGESQYVTYIQQLEGKLRELEEIARQFERALHDEVAALALAVGEHIAAQEIHQPRSSIQVLIERVLEHHHFALQQHRREGDEALTILLNPTDLQLLGDRMIGMSGIRVTEDASITRGGLRVSSREGILDATVERRRDLLMELIARLEEEG